MRQEEIEKIAKKMAKAAGLVTADTLARACTHPDQNVLLPIELVSAWKFCPLELT